MTSDPLRLPRRYLPLRGSKEKRVRKTRTEEIRVDEIRARSSVG